MGIGRPPPPIIRAMPERKRFFSIDPFPNSKHFFCDSKHVIYDLKHSFRQPDHAIISNVLEERQATCGGLHRINTLSG